jgi:hypothetical protein
MGRSQAQADEQDDSGSDRQKLRNHFYSPFEKVCKQLV